MTDHETHFEQKLDKILEKIDQLNERIAEIKVRSANERASTVEKFSTMVFETTKRFDGKLVENERSYSRQFNAQDDKYQSKFEEFTREFAAYRLSMERKITTVSVKVGLIFSIATSILVSIIVSLLK